MGLDPLPSPDLCMQYDQEILQSHNADQPTVT